MKLKDEIKIKGSPSEVLDQLEKFIRGLTDRNCDRITLKIKFKAWNAAERAARKAEKDD